MPKRRVSSPKRRIVSQASVCVENIRLCEKMAKYVGSAYHKRTPGDYRFVPPASPRPNKSLCDGSRSLNLAEAEALFREGLRRGMYSEKGSNCLPKYVWAVDADGHVFEAKCSHGGTEYHGYELGDDDAMRRVVRKEWRSRCPKT